MGIGKNQFERLLHSFGHSAAADVKKGGRHFLLQLDQIRRRRTAPEGTVPLRAMSARGTGMTPVSCFFLSVVVIAAREPGVADAHAPPEMVRRVPK